MATFYEILVHPLFLLLIGAGVSGGLVTWLSNWWQDRRKQQELKVDHQRKELDAKMDIVSKMTEIINYQRANALLAIGYKKTVTQAEVDGYYENLKKWYVESSLVSSKLQTYFPDADIRERWERYYFRALTPFSDAVTVYFSETSLKRPDAERWKEVRYILNEIRDYFSDNKDIDWDRLLSSSSGDWREGW